LKADGSVDNSTYATETYVGLSTVGLASETYVNNSLVGYATEGYVNNSLVGFITSGASGSSLTGIVTSITAGSGISIDQSTGNVTITSTGGGGGESYWTSTLAGIHTLSNVGIRTSNPTSALTVKGNTSLETLSVSGVSTFSGRIVGPVRFSKDGSATASQNVEINNDGSYAFLNVGGSSSFYFDSPNTNIRNTATGGRIRMDSPLGIDFEQYGLGGAYRARFDDISVSLYSSNNKKFETIGAGVTVTGTTFTNNLSVSQNAVISGILTATQINGTIIGSIDNATNLTGGYANASSLNVSGIATISQGRIQADAAANLRFGNIAAGSGSPRNIAIGDQVLVSLSGGSGRNIGIGELSYYDTTTGQYNIGIGERAGQKVSTGSYNVILGAYDGNSGGLDIRTSSRNVVIADGEGNIRQYINSSGNVGIKTTVVTEALTVAGIVSATGFYGTLNAGQLTGALPAIDGSALIGVVATGTGVEVQDDGAPVGTAGTINFGDNINVSFASGIAIVSTSLVGYATEGYVNNSIVGFITSGALNGYATENYVTAASVAYASTAGISSAVSETININTTGIITASLFSGSASGLTNLPSAQLTGALPALDGSALINLPAQPGDGVVVWDDTVNVGSARTLDFGTGLDVTISNGIATVTSSGGSLQSRTVVTGVTTSIANNGIGNTNITGFKSYALMRVGLSTAGWLRLYSDSTSRANDVSRSVGEDPTPGSGVIAEVVTTGISTTQIISPFVMGGNLDNPADTTIYAAITNLSGSTQAITANLTILQLEA
jgi:hypothetical protein